MQNKYEKRNQLIHGRLGKHENLYDQFYIHIELNMALPASYYCPFFNQPTSYLVYLTFVLYSDVWNQEWGRSNLWYLCASKSLKENLLMVIFLLQKLWFLALILLYEWGIQFEHLIV